MHLSVMAVSRPFAAMRRSQATPFESLPAVDARLSLDHGQETFDDDLGWIVSRFVERTGALGAMLSVHFSDGRPPGRLYTLGVPAERIALEDALAATAERLASGDGAIGHDVWMPLAVDDTHWRTLPLMLAHDSFHRIVLVALHAADADPAQRTLAEYTSGKLHPVLSGYFKLWLINLAQRRRIDGLASALNATDIAIFLFDGTGSLTFTNHAARGLLDDTDGLRRLGATVAATDLHDAVRLRVAIDHAAASSAGEAATTIVSLKRAGERRPLIAAVTPCERAPMAPSDPAAIAYVFNPDLDVALQLAPVCAVHGLTRSESRLVALLAEGHSVTEAAAAMRCKVSTVRTYLKQIFLKTGTSRQGDLIRLMMASLARMRNMSASNTL